MLAVSGQLLSPCLSSATGCATPKVAAGKKHVLIHSLQFRAAPEWNIKPGVFSTPGKVPALLSCPVLQSATVCASSSAASIFSIGYKIYQIYKAELELRIRETF